MGVVLTVLIGTVAAQPMTLHSYTRADGLVSDYVFDIFQDRDGFLWFGTDSGVVRYDGRDFTTYTTTDGLAADLVYRIYQDKQGDLWFGTFGGFVSRFNGQHFSNYSVVPTPAGNAVLEIAEDAFGRMYFRTGRQLYMFVDEEPQLLYNSTTYNGFWSQSLMLPEGDMLFPLQSALVWVQPTPDSVAVHTLSWQTLHDRPHALLSVSLIQSGTEAPRAVLSYIDGVHEHGHLSRTANGWHFEARSKHDMPAFAEEAASVGSKAYYVASTKGIWYIRDDELVTRYTHDSGGLPVNRIEDVLVDYEGTLWMATFGGGVQQLVSKQLRSMAYLGGPFATRTVQLYQDRTNRIWVLGQSGVGMWSPESARSYGGRYPYSRDVTERADGRFVMGTGASVTLPFAVDDPQFRNSSLEMMATIPNWVSSLHTDQGDTLWVGSFGSGVKRFVNDLPYDTLTVTDGLASNMVEDIQATQSGLWFLSRSEGVARYQQGQFQRWNSTNGLPSNAVFSVFEDDTKVWLGTDRGIAELDRTGVRTLTGAGRLVHHRIHALAAVPEAESELWVVADGYLYRLDTVEDAIRATIPLLSNAEAAINHALFDAHRPILHLATTQGYVQVSLRDLLMATVSPKVMLTALQAGDASVALPRRSEDRIVPIRYDQNNVTVSFAPLTFRHTDQVRVQYRLGGPEEAWSQPSTDRDVTFLNLAPGSYQFEVRAINADGLASAEPAQLTFQVVPPWWRTNGFLITVSLLVLAGLIIAIRLIATVRLRRQVRQLETQREVQAERARISRDLHDHVGAQLSNIITGIEVADMNLQANRLERLPESLKSLDEDARLTMLQLRETIWTLHQERVTLAAFCDQLQHFTRRQLQYRTRPAFRHVMCPESERVLRPTQALHLFRIAQEAIQNVLKHADADHLYLSLHTTSLGTICLEIRDDGTFQSPVGGDGQSHEVWSNEMIHASKLSGFGLENMARRAEALGGSLLLHTDASGTAVQGEIPLT